MHLSYCGAGYHGWQIQPNAVSVQEVIEDALSKALRRETKIVGAGRTDSGVNAYCMVAHFDAEPIEDTARMVKALNSIVGRDIAIHSIKEVAPDSHARFDATSRTYHYYCTTRKSPFFHRLAWHCPSALDFAEMNRAAELLLEVDDFTSFAKLHTDNKTNICRVSYAAWEPVEGVEGAWVFVITADRFLRNMVRAVVGTLVDVGRGKLTIDGFKEIIESKNRCSAGTSMPAHALYLWDVKYPYYSPYSE